MDERERKKAEFVHDETAGEDIRSLRRNATVAVYTERDLGCGSENIGLRAGAIGDTTRVSVTGYRERE